MAGKRKNPTMQDAIFSMSPVDRKTLNNWRPHINIHALEAAIRFKLTTAEADIYTALGEGVSIHYTDHRQVASVAEVLGLIYPHTAANLYIKPVKGRLWEVDGVGEEIVGTMVDVAAAAKPDIESGLELLMILNTYRAMIQELTGPMLGFNFNITIAGIVTTCMRLGVPVNFES